MRACNKAGPSPTTRRKLRSIQEVLEDGRRELQTIRREEEEERREKERREEQARREWFRDWLERLGVAHPVVFGGAPIPLGFSGARTLRLEVAAVGYPVVVASCGLCAKDIECAHVLHAAQLGLAEAVDRVQQSGTAPCSACAPHSVPSAGGGIR